jgi:hypothetical protein
MIYFSIPNDLKNESNYTLVIFDKSCLKKLGIYDRLRFNIN